MNFRKNSKRPSTPPPPYFWKNIMQFFYDRYGGIYARRCDGQIVLGLRSAFFSMYLVLIFLNTIDEKIYPEPCPHNLRSFLTANSTQNYFFIARMLSFFVTFAKKVPYLTFCVKMRQFLKMDIEGGNKGKMRKCRE